MNARAHREGSVHRVRVEPVGRVEGRTICGRRLAPNLTRYFPTDEDVDCVRCLRAGVSNKSTTSYACFRCSGPASKAVEFPALDATRYSCNDDVMSVVASFVPVRLPVRDLTTGLITYATVTVTKENLP